MTQYELEALISAGGQWPDAEAAIDDAALARRKPAKAPLYSGLLCYFPDSLEEVARVSGAGNDQHGTVGWDRSVSPDEFNSLTRHLLAHSRGELRDTDGTLHLAKVAWRALAALQRLLDASK
jgi:hypothetical protein